MLVCAYVVRSERTLFWGEPGQAEVAAVATYVGDQIASGRYPQLAALAGDPAATPAAGADRLEQRFELGLQALIDGAFRAWAYPGAGLGDLP